MEDLWVKEQTVKLRKSGKVAQKVSEWGEKKRGSRKEYGLLDENNA
jgi:hypothetical protein